MGKTHVRCLGQTGPTQGRFLSATRRGFRLQRSCLRYTASFPNTSVESHAHEQTPVGRIRIEAADERPT